jgi:hypothetical protein
MNHLNRQSRLRRHRTQIQPAPDVLEDRMVLSSGEGSTFAIMPGTVAGPGLVSTTSFEISPTLFSSPKRDGKIVIGIDITPAVSTAAGAATTSTLAPEIVSVKDASGHTIHVEHGRYSPKVMKENKIKQSQTSAVLVTLNVPKTGMPANDYTVQVKGLDATSGTYLLGYYLPGDAAGTGTVTQADIKTIKSEHGLTASNAKYTFDADTNRDGVINGEDVKIAREDLGVSTQVSPVVSVNLDPASDPAANRTTPYSTVHFAGTTTPNATVTFLDQASNSSTVATADSTGAYSILVPLVSGSNTFTVTTSDGFGQSISGAITPVVYDPPTTS